MLLLLNVHPDVALLDDGDMDELDEEVPIPSAPGKEEEEAAK